MGCRYTNVSRRNGKYVAYTWMPSLCRGHNVNAGPFDSEVEAAEAADALRVQLVSTTLLSFGTPFCCCESRYLAVHAHMLCFEELNGATLALCRLEVYLSCIQAKHTQKCIRVYIVLYELCNCVALSLLTLPMLQGKPAVNFPGERVVPASTSLCTQ